MTTTRIVTLAVLIVGAGFAVAQARIDPATGHPSAKGAVGIVAAGNHDSSIRPFRVSVPQRDLDELRRRILATRWPEKETVSDSSQGVPLTPIQSARALLVDGVRLAQGGSEAQRDPQFITTIDGLDIHFIHVRSKHQARCRSSSRTDGPVRSSSR